MPTQQRKIQFFIFLGIFLFSTMLMNRFIRSSIQSSDVRKVSKTKGKQGQTKPPEVFVEEKSKYHLTPDDPAKYNIKVQGEHDIPLTEQQWEYKMRQGFQQSSSENENPDLSLEGIGKTPAEIKERIADIEAQIKESEVISLNNPGDRNAQEKLQILYMLKATLAVLKDKAKNP